jgi:DNA primase
LDQYNAVRSLPFPAVAAALGIDFTPFKRDHRKQEYVGPCPIHSSVKNTGCFRYADDGRFHCFSCNAKGSGAIDISKAVKQISFKEAVELLQGVKVAPEPEKPATVPNLNASKPFNLEGYRKHAVDCPWLNERIPDQRIRDLYGVFCYNNPARKSAYSGRVMIPIKDVEGHLHAYLGRSISDMHTHADNPKYIFPRDFPKSQFLFGAYELRQHLASRGGGRSVYQHVFLVESPFCVMKFAMLGFPAVSSFGWSISEEQLCALRSLTKGMIYLPDRNKYHECGAFDQVVAKTLWLRFPSLPDSVEDPEHLSIDQIRSLI